MSGDELSPADEPALQEPLRCLHVVLSLDFGGLERMVVNLVDAARQFGVRSAVLCLERRGALAGDAEAAGASVICLNKRPGITPRLPSKVGTVLAGQNYDVVHTHQMGALFYAGGPARRLGLPVVHTEHGMHEYSRFRTKWMARWAVRHCSRLTSVSREIADGLIRRRLGDRQSVLVVPNGVPVLERPSPEKRAAARAALGIAPEEFLIGTVGRLAEIKRQDLLIEAFAEVHSRHRRTRLLLVGDGPLRSELENLAAQANVAPYTRFAGFQRDPAPFLQAMDLFVLSSRSEGVPLALLEAWGAELPVVASNVGGVAEIVDDGQTGILFPSGDQRALVAAIERMLRDPSPARSLAMAARERLEREYSMANMAYRYRSVYRDCRAAAAATSAWFGKRRGAM